MIAMDLEKRTAVRGRTAAARVDRAPEAPRSTALSREEKERYGQVPDEVDYVHHSCFASEETEDRLFGEGTEVTVRGWRWSSDPCEDDLCGRGGRTSLRAEEEVRLFLRYNYSRFRLHRLRRAQQKRFSRKRARKMIGWHCRALAAREALTQANMGLVLAMAKRTRISGVEFDELVSEGSMALLRSIERFDVSRGFKFSTYACRAILKSFSRLAAKAGRHRRHFPTEFDPNLERSDHDVRRHERQERDRLETLHEVLARNDARLTQVEQQIVWERFAIHGQGRKRTLSQVGEMVGLSNERVRQIQSIALRKIRSAVHTQLIGA